MPLNEGLKGKVYPRVELEVTAERVLQFADAIGEDNPAFRSAQGGAALGFGAQIASPTFLTVLHIMGGAEVVLDPDLGLDYTRVVHGEQEFEWNRPVQVADRLGAEPRIADIYSKGPNEFLVIEAEIKDPSGNAVAVSRATLLSRGTAERG